MADDRILYIVNFERDADGGCGPLIDCREEIPIRGKERDQFQENVFTNGPVNPGVTVAVFAISENEATREARKRGDAYGRAQWGNA